MKKVAHFLSILFGFLFGLGATGLTLRLLSTFGVFHAYERWNLVTIMAVYALACTVSMLLFVSLSATMRRWLSRMGKMLEGMFSNIPTSDLIFGVLGLIVGLVLAALISMIYNGLPWKWLQLLLSGLTYLVLGYLGVAISTKRRNEITNALNGNYRRTEKIEKIEKKEKYHNAKILDTSVIIDGRILDICRSGFVEGTLIVSDLVLNELRHIADSADPVKRVRGRRGLDILKVMQEELKQSVVVVTTGGKYKDIEEVDEKLVQLTKDLKGKIVTNDFNLNKMAAVHKVPVLNINELAQAVKPNMMTGEKIQVDVVKPGREDDQGVAFLDDGTMIVIDNGKSAVGKSIFVEITSIIQTASGRMIFAAPCLDDH